MYATLVSRAYRPWGATDDPTNAMTPADPDRADAVAETLLTVTGRDGVPYTMVAFEGGGIGIARDGRLLPGHRWADDGTKECVESLVRLAGLALDAPAG